MRARGSSGNWLLYNLLVAGGQLVTERYCKMACGQLLARGVGGDSWTTGPELLVVGFLLRSF